ncbi:MAG: hypothetical protein EBY64_05555 [Rhodobacteraceae bacterium]|nr:hypothetical protein [Paracoccaceae bacterium]
MKMTTEEAFVKVLQMHGIEHAFGIIGSAMMPISDLFPQAGIKFWDCAHEGSAGMMADGYTRATGEMSMMIAQNGPGITNFVTAVKTAYWNHTPLLLVTPQAANKTIGQGGFQEVEQMKLFEDMVAYQEEVRDPSRVCEVLNRVIMNAKRASAPAQLNIPRDMWTQVIDVELPAIVEFERPSGGEQAIAQAAELLSNAKNPVILNGAGVVLSQGGIDASRALAERLDAPVCVGYQHNDAFPGSHPLFAGPLGYNGSKAGMELISEADVVLCLGTRLNPFSTLPGYGMEYWPAVTQIVFRNYQWGAEKRNSTLWFDDNFVGTELDTQVSYAGIAQACGLKGVVARTMDELTEALHQAVKDQMENGITTLIEAMINQELGEPFRRDAMKKPVAVAGIDAADMRKQTAV